MIVKLYVVVCGLVAFADPAATRRPHLRHDVGMVSCLTGQHPDRLVRLQIVCAGAAVPAGHGAQEFAVQQRRAQLQRWHAATQCMPARSVLVSGAALFHVRHFCSVQQTSGRLMTYLPAAAGAIASRQGGAL